MSQASALRAAYPWIKTPVVVSAPMLKIAMAPLATSVSSAGGIGFLAAGFDVSDLEPHLETAIQQVQQSPTLQQIHTSHNVLPIGIGFLNWGADLNKSIALIEKYQPCAVWFFGPRSQPDDLVPWVDRIRAGTAQKTKIWVQVGTVAEAIDVTRVLHPDTLVVQGSDAGGHGLARSASVISLVPEVSDALVEHGFAQIPLLAAGGVMDGRGLAASLALGAAGVVMGTRFLASVEANIAPGYRDEILRASDGGVTTVRSTVYDRVRGIYGWPARYDGRGVINRSFLDDQAGMTDEKNKSLYDEELKKGDLGWGPDGRLTTYAGTGVGLVKQTLPAAEIVEKVVQEAKAVLARLELYQ